LIRNEKLSIFLFKMRFAMFLLWNFLLKMLQQVMVTGNTCSVDGTNSN